MKTILMLAIGLVAMVCRGQSTYSTNDLFITNTFAAATLTTTNLGTNVIDVTRYAEAGFALRFQGTNAAATNLVQVPFLRSHDGVNFEGTPAFALSGFGNGTNAVWWDTNLVLGSFGFLKLGSPTNANSGDVTNVALWITEKGYRRDR